MSKITKTNSSVLRILEKSQKDAKKYPLYTEYAYS